MIAGFAETFKSSPHPEKESGIKIFDELTNRVPVLPDGSLGALPHQVEVKLPAD